MQTASTPNPHSITRQASQLQPRSQLKSTLQLKMSLPAFPLGFKFLHNAAAFTAGLLLVLSTLQPPQLTGTIRKPTEREQTAHGNPAKGTWSLDKWSLVLISSGGFVL